MLGDNFVGLDFETYSDVNLIKHGAPRYFASPHFTPLIAVVSSQEGTTFYQERVFFWNQDGYDESAVHRLASLLSRNVVCGHNVSFEEECLRWLGIYDAVDYFIDSAVLARAMGASSKLARCAPQLLGKEKVALGEHLIKVFSIPSSQYQPVDQGFNPQIIRDHPRDWEDYAFYCGVDSELSLELVSLTSPMWAELDYSLITREMNNVGWKVDVELLSKFEQRYEANTKVIMDDFHDWFRTRFPNVMPINLNSTPQLKRFCAEHGIRASSFDEAHVTKLRKLIGKKLLTTGVSPDKAQDYLLVDHVLSVKQEVGGSSLSKLQKIRDLISKDGILRDNYLHFGAGQTARTSGRGVQLQNVKQLGDEISPVTNVWMWDNDELARNIRQLFTSRHPNGELLVGDFSSVEARALAGLAGEVKVLNDYRMGLDAYKVAASDHYGIPYASITKGERKFGKVGVLSCGYGSGYGAVRDFAEKMGIILTDTEAQQIVTSWRGARTLTVQFWANLQKALEEVIAQGIGWVAVTPITETSPGIIFRGVAAPLSLRKMGYQLSVEVEVPGAAGPRLFHGVHQKGSEIVYHKPVDSMSSQLWTTLYTDKKGKQQNYRLYGGKLAGIITQSICREIFFEGLEELSRMLKGVPNAEIIGQFHDEIVVDWWPSEQPGALSFDEVYARMGTAMGSKRHAVWPIEAEIKSAYRYIK